MTISTESRKAGPYTGNGSTTIFAFAFKIFQASDLMVVKWPITTEAETTLVLNTDYTVQMNADQDASPGGTITLPVALPATHKVVITTSLQYLQSIAIANHGGFYPSVINAALDRITIFAQQLKEKIDRAVVVPLASTSTPADYMTSLSTQVETATTQAGIATTQAGIATTQAGNAANSATLALNSTPIGTLSSVAGVDTITAAASPTLTQQAALNTIWNVPAAGANTGAATINIDSQGAVAIVRPDGTALQANDIPAAGYVALLEKRASNFVLLNPANLQTQHLNQRPELPQISVTANTGALTIAGVAKYLDFRSATLTSGTPSTVNADPADLVIPSGATLGSVTTVSARIIVVEMNNAGTSEYAVANISGGLQMDETNLISTTAIDTASDAANVWYSTTARSNLPYRVVACFDAVNTTGAWGSPTLVQPAGGNALAAMSSFGYGQKWTDVTGSRAIGTTYYNTTGKMIEVYASGTNTVAWIVSATVNGFVLNGQYMATAGTQTGYMFRVPPGGSYIYNGPTTLVAWYEFK